MVHATIDNAQRLTRISLSPAFVRRGKSSFPVCPGEAKNISADLLYAPHFQCHPASYQENHRQQKPER